MFKNARHTEILEILKNERFASVSDLSKRLFASQPTIRRDLDILEKQGYLKRSHGGAVPSDGRSDLPVSFRSGTNAQEKLRICKAAASLIPDGALIFTDASTTALQLAGCIKETSDITVVTNGYLACKLFSDKGLRVFSTGGRLLANSLAFVGDGARRSVESYNADVMLFSASSLDENGMISDYSEEETSLRLCMASRAKTKIFLCISSKFGSRSSFNLFPLSSVDYAVTGEPLSESIISSCGLTLISSENAYVYSHCKA
jgi:DeoR/GlpR family transcriptional regulator of sugar metabolism